MAPNRPEVSPEARELVERLAQESWPDGGTHEDWQEAQRALLAYIAALEARAEGGAVAWRCKAGRGMGWIYNDWKPPKDQFPIVEPLYTRPTHTDEDGGEPAGEGEG